MKRITHFARQWIMLLLAGIIAMGPQAALAEATGATDAQIYRVVNFQVNYRDANDPGSCDPNAGALQPWPADARAAMNYLVDILDDLINSAVPIVIDACYQVDNDAGTLASAGPFDFLTQDQVPALPVANRQYAIALANAIANADQNGADPEITASINSQVNWDFCTVGCTVDPNRSDFVSTVLHELLHGLGFFTSFDPDPNSPNIGTYSNPPNIMDQYVIQVADNSLLIDLPNNSTTLMDAMQQGSGTIAFNGPNTLAINNNRAPFIYSPAQYSQGSSMSHWDDDHATNLGRLMNAATDDGPSSRVVDAITLTTLKDIGWNVNDPRDHGDGVMAAYGDAQHINAAGFVNYMRLGATFSAEATPAANDASDDGVAQVGTWTVGANGGQITVSVRSNVATARGCVSGWIDWNNDADFADADETIAQMQPVAMGDQNLSFNIPASVAGNVAATFYNARIRLIPDWDGDGVCNDQVAIDPSVGVFGGEVEDYQWSLKGGTVIPPAPTRTIYLPVIIR